MPRNSAAATTRRSSRSKSPARAGAGVRPDESLANAMARTAAAAAGTVKRPGLDLSKYTVFFTGVFNDEDEKLVFTGTLNEFPGTAKVSGVAKGGITKKSRKLATIEFDEFKAHVAAAIEANYCGGNVAPSYILGDSTKEGVFDSNPIRLVVKGPAPKAHPTRGGKIAENMSVGFLIGRQVKEGRGSSARTGVYLDVVCAMRGIGVELLSYFHKLVVAANLGDFIKLSSLANVITLYPKHGYKFKKDCFSGRDAISLPESFRSRDFTKDPPPINTESAYKDAQYMDFMHGVLHKEGLTVKKEKGCIDTSISKAQFESDDCAEDGFSMAKCDLSDVPKAGGGRKSRKTRKNRR